MFFIANNTCNAIQARRKALEYKIRGFETIVHNCVVLRQDLCFLLTDSIIIHITDPLYINLEGVNTILIYLYSRLNVFMTASPGLD